ncbi:hypothetical protein [Burkholderia cepacia]|uniref:hypothetical protein n=1 Tax=Burkholderia cepacia TaxID=292 RepID=UPI00298F60BD|nr:hypothetical protein [Burkholderia cepacia]
MNFESFEDRLENWGRVVRNSPGRSVACNSWADLYIALRDAGKMRGSGQVMTKDELDGWIVEAAWSALPNHAHKWLLKYSYVWNMGDEEIQCKVRKRHGINLRGRDMRLAMAEARRAISKILSDREAEEIIRNASKNGCKPPSAVL